QIFCVGFHAYTLTKKFKILAMVGLELLLLQIIVKFASNKVKIVELLDISVSGRVSSKNYIVRLTS
ncbi:hypothetical protein D6817_04240, partial [Candidatus Pacearchaeota archaeon]